MVQSPTERTLPLDDRERFSIEHALTLSVHFTLHCFLERSKGEHLSCNAVLLAIDGDLLVART